MLRKVSDNFALDVEKINSMSKCEREKLNPYDQPDGFEFLINILFVDGSRETYHFDYVTARDAAWEKILVL